MLQWLAQSPTIVVALLVVFVPGVAALWAIGVRGLAAVAAAPLFTVASTAVIALLLGVTGWAWSPLSWAVATAVLVVVAAVVGRVLGPLREKRPTSARRWLLPTGLVLGAALGIWRLTSYISDPTGISQTNDAVFHMNAVRYILDTADASSLHVNGVIGGSSFYPAAWHAVVSLVVSLTGAGIPVAANALTLVIGAVIWTAGIAWLTRAVTGSTRAGAVAAVLSSALQTFPLLMFQWGVLFPNALSTALLPAAIALVLVIPGWVRHSPGWRTVSRSALLVLVAAAAIVFAQPATLLPWLAVVLVRLTAWLLGERSTPSAWARWSIVAGAWVLLAIVWFLLSRSTSGSHWPPFRGKVEVFLDVLLNGQLRIPFAVGISILAAVGLVVAWRRSSLRWFVFAWAGISALYILVAAIGAPIVRVYVLGAWYADPYRIAALAPVVVIPLAALGLCGLVDLAIRYLDARSRRLSLLRRTDTVTLAAAVLIMLVLILVRPVAMPSVIEGTYDRESRYISADDSYLSPDERDLLEALPSLVDDPEATVIANPSTGSGFGYMLSGLDVIPKTWSAPRTDSWAVLSESLRDVGSDPTVCAALAENGAPEYVLDFGLGDTTPGRFEMPGMTDFDGQPGFDLVAEIGEASLWRITACAR